MGDWCVVDHLLRLAVTLLAAVAIPVLVRKRVGGSPVSYTAIVCGLTFLVMAEVLWLTSPLAPDWRLRDADLHLPAYGGGYLLVLIGFLLLMRDMRMTQVRDRQATSDERARAEAARLQEARLQVALDELNHVQNELRRERDFIRGIIETNDVLIISIDLDDDRLTMFNKGAEQLTGYTRAEVIGRQYREIFIAPEDRAKVVQTREDIKAGRLDDVGSQEHVILTKSGARRRISWTYTVSHDDQGRATHMAAFGRDVTEQRQMQESLERAKADLERANVDLERLATTDYVTGLINRRLATALFEREVVRSRRACTPLAAILMDLDRFKAINDTYGHEAGDAVLKGVAPAIAARLRTTDIVARYGGDEFLLVLPDTDVPGAELLAEEVRRLVQRTPVKHGAAELAVTVSLGLAMLEPGQHLTVDQLVRRADEAMYRAKKLGGNRVAVWGAPAEADVASGLASAE